MALNLFSKQENLTLLSLVLPVFNEEESLEAFFAELKPELEKLTITYEIIFVDDGSTDGTFEKLCRFREESDQVKIIQFARNFGKSQAMHAGFDTASGDIVVTMDVDLQDNPADLPKFLSKIEEGNDLVCAWRQKRQDSFIKVVSSKFFNSVTSFFTGIPLHDFNCGMKAYRKVVLSSITIYGEMHRFVPVIVKASGFHVTEIQTLSRPRQFGKSKFGLRRFVSGMLDLITVLFLTKFFKKPAHFFGSFALVFMGLGLFIGLYVTSLWFRFGNIQNRHPLLILGVLFIVVGVQFFSTGLIGEMTSYAQRRKEKGYHIRREIK